MTPHLLLTLPVAVPLATLALCALLQSRPALQRAISLLGSAGLLIASGLLLRAVLDGTVLATQLGSWAAPFGISFVADRFAAAMVVITGLMAVAVSVYALASGARERERAWFHPLYHGLLLGVTGAFQFRPSDELEINITGLYSRFNNDRNEKWGEVLLRSNERSIDVVNPVYDSNNNMVSATLNDAWVRTEHYFRQSQTEFHQLGASWDQDIGDKFRFTLTGGF